MAKTSTVTLLPVYNGKHTYIEANVDGSEYVVHHGPNKAHRKTFKGESAWSNAQRFAWDLGDLTCNL